MTPPGLTRMPETGWLRGTVRGRTDWTEDLFTLTVDAPVEAFVAGQFLRLGLDEAERWVSRAYSVASPPGQNPAFYIAVVPGGELSPDLHRLSVGDAVGISLRAAGHFTLEHVPDAEVLWLICTGTGLAPYLSMLGTEEPWRRFGRVILVHGVRHAADLSYGEALAALARARAGRFQVVPVVSRDPDAAIFGRIPARLDAIEETAGQVVRAETSQVLICGNPDMVVDMEVLLVARGLRRNKLRLSGHITTERYW